MTILSDGELEAAMTAGSITVYGLQDGAIQPASIDLHLAWPIKVMHRSPQWILDPEGGNDDAFIEVGATDDEYTMNSGQFILASTVETVLLGSRFAAQVSGISSLGRIGLDVSNGCGWIDPGFAGKIVLEVSNNAKARVVLRPGMRIGQLVVHRLGEPAERPYGHYSRNSKYQGQDGVWGARPEATGRVTGITATSYPDGRFETEIYIDGNLKRSPHDGAEGRGFDGQPGDTGDPGEPWPTRYSVVPNGEPAPVGPVGEPGDLGPQCLPGPAGPQPLESLIDSLHELAGSEGLPMPLPPLPRKRRYPDDYYGRSKA